MHPIAFLSFLSLAAALPHIPQKKSFSIDFTRRSNAHPLALQEQRRSRLARRQNGTQNDVTELINENNSRYIASVQIAGQNLDLILDTGSTDTFVFSTYPDAYEGIPASELPPLFDNATAQDTTYLGLQYNASYGSGDSGITTTLGAIGLTTLSINGTDLTANNLTFANLYQSSSGTGASGLLGLSFPLDGDIFLHVLGTFNATGTPLTAQQATAYYPLVPLLQQQGQIQDAMFSLIVDRIPLSAEEAVEGDEDAFNYTSSQGTLTIGDYPEGYTESDFTFSGVPIVEISEAAQAIGLPAVTGNRWTTPLDAIYFNGKLLSNTTQDESLQDDGGYYFALIDSGNPTMNFPSDVMSQITEAYAANPNNITMPCDSQFDLILQFAGKNFTLNKDDLLVPSDLAVDSTELGGEATTDCQFNAQPTDPDSDEFGPYTSITYMFGDSLLRNVAMVFDYGNLLDAANSPPRMGFAQRT